MPATAITIADHIANAAADEAFAALVQRQARFVFRVAYACLRHHADSEDVVQETFLKLYRSRAWKRIDDERGFLARTAWRLAQGRRRKQNVGRSVPDLADQTLAIDLALTQQARLDTVHRLIDTLPPELREPLLLSTVEGMTSRSIGELLKLPQGTVRTRLLRARDTLKERLAALERSTSR